MSKLLAVVPWPGLCALILIHPCDSWLVAVESTFCIVSEVLRTLAVLQVTDLPWVLVSM